VLVIDADNKLRPLQEGKGPPGCWREDVPRLENTAGTTNAVKKTKLCGIEMLDGWWAKEMKARVLARSSPV
jgi:hypothetical protein